MSGILFGGINLKKEEIERKRVIEVGSLDVNGSLRPLMESYNPKEYMGVDIVKGHGVDRICKVENLVEDVGQNIFDVVISTELLEHVRDWKKAISSIKNVCKEGGIILITTRSIGFPYHAYPYDFWRFEMDDMISIFGDCEILALERDPSALGVFIKVRKPENFMEVDQSDYALYSVITNKRVKDIEEKDFKSLYFKRIVLKQKLKNFIIARAYRLFNSL